jgi:hypothetical protein
MAELSALTDRGRLRQGIVIRGARRTRLRRRGRARKADGSRSVTWTTFSTGESLKQPKDWTLEMGSAVSKLEVVKKNLQAGDGHTHTAVKVWFWSKNDAGNRPVYVAVKLRSPELACSNASGSSLR